MCYHHSISYTPIGYCFDECLWIDPKGALHLYWAQSYGFMDGRIGVWESVCEDPDAPAPRFSAPRRLANGIMMNKPIVLSTGEWLFPIAIWKLDIYYDYRKSALTPDDVAGAYGGGVFVDIPNIFRDFDADENDPASYDFYYTDNEGVVYNYSDAGIDLNTLYNHVGSRQPIVLTAK